MASGKLSIARGGAISPTPALARPEAPVAVLVPTDRPGPDPHLVEHRLTALERLARLLEQGVLSPEEFAAEKALVLRLPADELRLASPVQGATPCGPSLIGRLLRWQLLPAGIAAGLALSWYVQPHETMRIADQLFRAIGA